MRKQWLLLFMVAVSMYGIIKASHQSLGKNLLTSYTRFIDNIHFLSGLPYPFEKLHSDLAETKKSMQLEDFQNFLKDEKVSYFGMNPGFLVYNGFNYINAPVPISFAAWNSDLINRNRRFFSDSKLVPGLLILDLNTIDNKLLAQDDSLSQLELLQKFDPLLSNGEQIILKRNTHINSFSFFLLEEVKGRLNEWIDVPLTTDPTWIQITQKKGLLNRGLAVLYKSAEYRIELQDTHKKESSYKFVPEMGALGFLINPLIHNNEQFGAVIYKNEFKKFLNDNSPYIKRVTKLRIICKSHGRTICEDKFNVKFSRISGLNLGRIETDDFLLKKSYPYGFKLHITKYELAHPIELRYAHGHNFYQLHPPAKITIEKPEGARTLSGLYAILPNSYTGEGTTDGVLLKIYFRGSSDQALRMVYEKDISPIQYDSDQGPQNLSVTLPNIAGTLVVEINPKSNNKWDQFVIKKLSLN